MKLLACALATLILAAPQASPPVDAPLPDPAQTFNLFFRFLRDDKVAGAQSLVLDSAVDERVTAMLKDISNEIRQRHLEWRGFDTIIDGDFAVVLMLDGDLTRSHIDIDPCYLTIKNGMWLVLPTFGDPRYPLPYLSDAQQDELKALEVKYDVAEDKARAALREKRGT